MSKAAPVSFVDLLAEEATSGPGTRCHVGLLLEQLDPATRAQVSAALDDPSITASAIYRALNRLDGVTIGEAPVSRHKGRRCKCPSTTS